MNATRIGLIISGVIVLVIVLVVVLVSLPSSVPAPTDATTAPGALDLIALTCEPAQLVNIPTGGDGAAATYAEVVKLAAPSLDWHDFKDFKDKVDASHKPLSEPSFVAILAKLQTAAAQPLGDATELNFDDQFKMSVSADVRSRSLFYGIGKMGCKMAMDIRDTDKARARQAYEAVYVYGYRLWHNGVYCGVRNNGLASMSEAAAGLASLLEDLKDPKAAAAKSISSDIDQASSRWIEKEKKTVPSVQPHAGDMAYMALHDQDRAWRIQGITWLGVAKWTSVSGKDRDAVQKFLDQHGKDNDPLFAKAAREAAAFSVDDKNQIPND